MQRPNLRDWMAWLVLSISIAAYLVPATVEGGSGSVLFALLMWWVVRLESTSRGFATQDKVIAFVLFEKRKELAKIPLENLVEVPYHRLGRFVFPKRLSNCWTLCMFIGIVGGFEPMVTGYFQTGAFGSYAFDMIAEIWTLVVFQMAFWIRFNITHRNWKTPRHLFDEICEQSNLELGKKASAWKKCLKEGLVTEN